MINQIVPANPNFYQLHFCLPTGDVDKHPVLAWMIEAHRATKAVSLIAGGDRTISAILYPDGRVVGGHEVWPDYKSWVNAMLERRIEWLRQSPAEIPIPLEATP